MTAILRYIVGLSNIQLDNPYQLVVFDSTGQLLAKQHVTATVACLTPEEYHGLKIRYASKFQVLQGHVCSRDGRIYIDYERMNMPRRLGSLWAQLSEHRRPFPLRRMLVRALRTGLSGTILKTQLLRLLNKGVDRLQCVSMVWGRTNNYSVHL